MYPLNYLIFFGILLSFMTANYILFRNDIVHSKISVISLLFLISAFEFSYFLLSETALQYNPRWVIIYIFFYVFFHLFILFYTLEGIIKSYYFKILYPIFIFVVSIILTFPMLMRLIPKDNTLNNIDIIEFLMHYNYILFFCLGIWIFLLIFYIIKKDIFLLPVAIMKIILIGFLFIGSNNVVYLYNTIFILVLIYLPAGITLSYLRKRNYSLTYGFENDIILNGLEFGMIIYKGNNKCFINKYLLKILYKNNENPTLWVKNNEKILSGIDDSFNKIEITAGHKTYYFYVKSMRYAIMGLENRMLIFFDVTKNNTLENISKRYEKLLSKDVSEKIIQYNFEKEYNDMNEFLKGFAHNSFNLISVIKTGVDYIKDGFEKLEVIIFSSKNLNKDREQLKHYYNIFDKTLKLSQRGITDIQKSFYLLNNKLKNMQYKEKIVFNMSDFIEQEIFYYIDNTHYKYDLKIEINDGADIEIAFDYKRLSAIFHNLLQFIINRMNLLKSNTIKIEIKRDFEYQCKILIFADSVEYDDEKLKNIIYSGDITEEDEYNNLVNAIILIKTSNIILNKLDSDALILELKIK